MLLFNAYMNTHLEYPGSGPQLCFNIENQKPTPDMIFTRGLMLPSVGEQTLGQKKDLSSKTATFPAEQLAKNIQISDSSLESHISHATFSHKSGSQEVLIPLPTTDRQIQLLFYTQPLAKDESIGNGKEEKEGHYFPSSSTL